MKTLSVILSGSLVAFGFYTAIANKNLAGVFLMIIGSLAFLILTRKTKKIGGYQYNHFMNK
jgi:hypothetical protein